MEHSLGSSILDSLFSQRSALSRQFAICQCSPKFNSAQTCTLQPNSLFAAIPKKSIDFAAGFAVPNAGDIFGMFSKLPLLIGLA